MFKPTFYFLDDKNIEMKKKKVKKNSFINFRTSVHIMSRTKWKICE